MSYQQVNSSMSVKGPLSSTQKKQILWNIIEPGDPYDIKKSMIAQLPGDTRNFMGPHPQIVCLMQAAEIERLCQFLEEYKLRYRQTERRQLDRHSYEVQIKELTQKIVDSGSHQTENLKLRQFLKKQTAQLEQLRKKPSTDTSLGPKYTQALHHIQALTNQCSSFEKTNKSLTVEVQQLRMKISALEQSKIREIEDLKMTLSFQSNSNYQKWKADVMDKFVREREGYQMEVRRWREANQAKNKDIQDYQNRVSSLESQLQQQLHKQENFSRLQSMTREYEDKFGILSIEIQRLNNVLRSKAHQCEDMTIKIRHLTEQLDRKNRQINDNGDKIRRYEQRVNQNKNAINQLNQKIFRLSESEVTVQKYERKINEFSEEIERLNSLLRKKSGQVTQLQGKISQMEYEFRKIDFVKKENSDMKKSVDQNYNLKRSLAEFENRVQLLLQENQRLNNNLRMKMEELFNMDLKNKTYEKQIEGNRMRLESMEKDVSQNWRSRVNTLEQQASNLKAENDELRRKLFQFDDLNRRLTEYENKIALMSQQIERLNEMVHSLRNENQSQKQKLFESSNLSRINIELENKITTLTRTRISENNAEMEELNRKVYELSEKNRQIPEFESRIIQLSQQLDRINSNLRSKIDEGSNLESRIKILQSQINESEKSKIQIEHKLKYYHEQSENLKSRLSEAGETRYSLQQYESRVVEMNEQINRLQLSLKSKIEELQISQVQTQNIKNAHKNLGMENEELKRMVSRIEEDASLKINEYGNRLQALGDEIERLNSVLKNKTDELFNSENRNRQLEFDIQNLKKGGEAQEIMVSKITQEWQYKYTSITTQFNQKQQIFQQRQQQLTNQIRRLESDLKQSSERNQKLPDYESRIILLSQELERVNYNLSIKVQEINNLNIKNSKLEIEYDNVRRNNSESEYKISQLTQDHHYKYSTLQTQYRQVTADNEELRRRLAELSDIAFKIGEYEGKLKALTVELERVNSNLRAQVNANGELENNIRNVHGDFDNLRRTAKVYEERISTYELQIKQITHDNEQLRRRIQELTDVNRKVGDFEHSVGTLSAQIQRLNDVLRIKIQENGNLQNNIRILQQESEGFRRSVSEYEVKITQITHEYQSKIKTFESTTNQDLNIKIRELSEANLRLGQYEKRITMTAEQIDRLNRVLREKDQECTNVQGQFRIAQQELELSRRNYSDLEFKLTQFEQQNEELRVRLQNLGDVNRRVTEYQTKIALLTQEIQRLNGVLRGKDEECRDQLTTISTLQQEIQRLQRGTGEYDSKFILISNEIQRLNKVLQSTSEELSESRNRESKQISQIQRLNNTLRLKVEESYRYEQSHTELIERLRVSEEQLRELAGENSKLKNANVFLEGECNNSKNHLLEYEGSIKKLYSEFERLQTIMHDQKKQILSLRSENKDLDDVVEKNRFLSAEIDRLNGIIEGMKLEVEEVRLRFSDEAALHKRINEHMALMVVLFAEIEALRQRVKDKEKEVEDVRRSSLAPFKI